MHLVRHSLTYVSWKQRKAVAADLRAVYPLHCRNALGRGFQVGMRTHSAIRSPVGLKGGVQICHMTSEKVNKSDKIGMNTQKWCK